MMDLLAARELADEPEAQEQDGGDQLGQITARVATLYHTSAALQEAAQPVFIVGKMQAALDIIDAGGAAVSLGDPRAAASFLARAKERPPRQPLIIALGDGSAWQAAECRLEAGLAKQGAQCHRGRVWHGAQGAAASKELLERFVRAEVNKAKSTERERRAAHQRASAAMRMQAFNDGIDASANTPCIPTGFAALDAALDGGLYEGLYIAGAISTLGKTTFMLQVADQAAAAGTDVVFISLEMAASELMAKSISRHTALDVKQRKGNMQEAKTVRGILDGKRYERYSQSEHGTITLNFIFALYNNLCIE